MILMVSIFFVFEIFTLKLTPQQHQGVNQNGLNEETLSMFIQMSFSN